MPLVIDPDTPASVAPSEKVRDNAERTAIVDTTKTPLTQLLPMIEGQGWTVQYYSQILGATDEPEPQSLSLDPALQQYHLITDFEMRVTDQLSYEYDAETQSNRLVGSATIYPNVVVPNRGDMFMADIGDGKIGIFTLDSVTPLAYGMDRCYSVQYNLVTYQDDARVADLEEKTVQTSHFVRDYLISGKNPVLTNETMVTKTDLEEHGHRLFELFKNQFISRKHRYILMPKQELISFDSFVAGALQKYINVSQDSTLRRLNWPSIKSVPEMKVDTIWDCLLNGMPPSTMELCKKMQLVDTWTFKNTPTFSNIFYTPIRRLIYPAENPLDVDDDYEIERTVTGYSILAGTTGVVTDFNENDDPNYVGPKYDIALVTADDYYVFSQAFYDGTRDQQSLLELTVTQMLHREVINSDDVNTLCEKAEGWGSLEQFYYIPILLMAIDYVLRRL